ncbi:MAG TPA: phage holin family protein [Chloroflexota bacterium]|nr:phage holin family protein [Chloroflexota bacterium]
MGILIRFAVTFVAVFVTSLIVPNMLRYDNLGSLAIFAAVLAVINALVRPIVILLTCPIQILTLGLASLAVNALLFLVAAGLVPGVEVGGFVNAFVAALIVAVVGWVISLVIHD